MEKPALVQRPSGLIVGADLAFEPDTSGKSVSRPGHGVAYDLDGRRRVVLTKDERKRVAAVIRDLIPRGLALALLCRADTARPDGKPPCGGMLTAEGVGTPDHGFGCQCTRVHFR